MAQITEDYVSFETAKLLKEKGFDEDIDLWYDENGDTFFKYHYAISRDWRVRQNQQVYQHPTLQMAMKWLREIHNLCLFVIPATIDDTLRPGYAIYPKCDNKWEWCASKNDGSKATFGCDINKNYCDSYEDAVEAAIKYCLTNLI